MPTRFLLFLILFLGLTAQAQADAMNRVDFQVEASRDVSNDLLTTSLSVETTGRAAH